MATSLDHSDILERVNVTHAYSNVTAVREFILSGVDDETITDRPFTALNFTAGIPAIFSVYPGHTEGGGSTLIGFDPEASLVCVRRECEPLTDSPDKYRVTCFYGWVDAVTGPPQNPAEVPDPANGLPYAKYSFGASLQTVETSEGAEGPVGGSGPYNLVGTMKVGYETPTDDQPPEQVVVATKQEVVHSYIFQRHEDRHPSQSGVDDYVGKVNLGAWNGLATNRALCTRISAEPNHGKSIHNRTAGNQSYITTYEFQAIPTSQQSDIGFDIVAVLKDANGNPIADPTDDETKKRFRLYDEIDFNNLNLIP